MSTTSAPRPARRRNTSASAPGRRAILVDGSAAELFQLPDPTGELPLDGSRIVGCVLGDGPGASLVRSFLADRIHDWARWQELVAAPPTDAPGQVIVTGDAWRRHGARIWSELRPRRIYVARGPRAGRGRTVVAARKPADVAALLRQARPHERQGGPAIVHATRPSSTLSVAAAMGSMSMGYYPLDDGFSHRLDDGFDVHGLTPVYVAEGPAARVVRAAVERLEPDLLVMGWRRHWLLRRPWLAHPTAWSLSRTLPLDVLLVRLDPEEA